MSVGTARTPRAALIAFGAVLNVSRKVSGGTLAAFADDDCKFAGEEAGFAG